MPKSPRHYRAIDSANHQAEGFNRLCGDKVQIYLTMVDDVCEDGSFYEGESCAICKGSASMLLGEVIGKRKDEIIKLIDSFSFVSIDLGQQRAALKAVEALSVVQNYPTRLKCLNLPWTTMEAAVCNSDEAVTTE